MVRILTAGLLLLVTLPSLGVTVTLSCGAVGIELEVCREGAERWAAATGNRVVVVSTPNSSSDRLALYQQLLAAGSADIDVFQIDVIWPGILHQHFIDLAPHLDPEEAAGHFPTVLTNNRVEGRLIALPWFMDAGLLYYRADLLEKHGRPVPETWEALEMTARHIQAEERAAGNRELWGFVWQGRAYEGLTCNALEWVHSHGGGRLVDDEGQLDLANAQAATAVDRAAGWVGTITPPGVLNYDEEQSRGVFQSGRALFMRNWPYAWPLVDGEASPIRGRVGVAPLPRGEGGESAATLGGWQLAVSRHSAVQAEAIDLVRFLTSADEQKRRALKGGYNPTRPALYDDPELLAANPLFGELRAVFSQAVARPAPETGRHYNRLSSGFWNAVHATLAGRGDAGQNLRRAERQLQRQLR